MIKFGMFSGAVMKKLVTAVAAIALIGTPAFAAPPAPAPVPTWTGWYAGVNVGASFGRAKTDFNGGPITVANAVQSATSAPFTAFTDKTHPSGFIGGGQIGYNWQYSPLIVVGLEADFQGALEREHSSFTTALSVPGVFAVGGTATTFTGTVGTDYTTKIDWFGTVRARIGYLWGDGQVLTYVTGGLAYGRVDAEGTTNVSGGETFGALFSLSQAFSQNAVNTGWVVGYGTEGKTLIPGLTYKIESLYMDLGTLDTTGVTTSASASGACGICTATGGQITTHTHFTDAILRVGLNYQFH